MASVWVNISWYLKSMYSVVGAYNGLCMSFYSSLLIVLFKSSASLIFLFTCAVTVGVVFKKTPDIIMDLCSSLLVLLVLAFIF